MNRSPVIPRPTLWLVELTLVLTSVLSACGSSSSDRTPSDDGTSNMTAAITVDNHVESLRYLFDIFAGQEYGPDMLSLPDYPDPAYNDDTVPLPDIITPDYPDSAAEMITCINGGTATFTPFGLDRDGWNFEFDDCQYEGTLYNGNVNRELFRRGTWLDLTSTGLTIESQSTKTSFSGRVDYKPGDVSGELNRHYIVEDVDLAKTDNTEKFELVDAVFEFGIVGNSFVKTLEGKYTVKSVVTGDQRLDVRVLETLRYNIFGDPNVPDDLPDDFAYFFQTGILQVIAENGDYLRLDADTGDNSTVNIEILNDGVTDNFQQPWTLWRENLEFNFDLLD